MRHYRNGELAGTHHVTENLENEWDKEDVHRDPLIDFLAGELAVAETGATR